MKNSAWSIGRTSADCTHILLDDDTISGNHATLNYQNGKYYLIDNNSLNGTFLIYNNEKIYLNQHYEVRLDDELYFGEKRYVLREVVNMAKSTQGIEASELISLDSNFSVNRHEEYNQQPQNEKKEEKIEQVHKLGKGKRIRCSSCTSPIFSDQVCPKCGSVAHLKMKNY